MMRTNIPYTKDPWQRWRTSIALFFLLQFLPTAHSQSSSYSNLPSAPVYSSGAFSAPDGPTQVFTEGAHLNVTWQSDFTPVNLYLIRGQDYTHPIGLQLNYFNTYYYWRINGGGDLSKPFLFRIVKANGTEEEQALRGFQSEAFWIAPASNAVPTSSLSSTHIASATGAFSVSRKDGSTATGQAKSTGSGGGLSSGAEAGIGAGVGVGVGLALLAGVGFFFWRRRQKRNKDALQQQQRQSAPPPQPGYGSPPPMSYNQYRDDYSSTANDSYRPWPTPTALSSQSHPHSVYAYELQPNDMRSPVEAPSTRWQEPHELSAHAEHYSKAASPPPQTLQPWDGRDAT